MTEVQAVKDLDKVKLISHLLERRYSKQISDIWNVGLNLALRISDLLSIRFEDIHQDRLIIKEAKTGKLANIQLNQKALTTIKQIQAEHPNHVYLFQSYRNQQALHKDLQTAKSACSIRSLCDVQNIYPFNFFFM